MSRLLFNKINCGAGELAFGGNFHFSFSLLLILVEGVAYLLMFFYNLISLIILSMIFKSLFFY